MRKMKIDLKQINRKDLLLPVTIMAALLAAIFAVVMFLGRAERITVKEPLYQYIFSDKDAYSDGITMKKTEDAVMVDNGVQTVESSGAPYYYEGQDKLILSDNFLYYDRNGEIRGKAPYFTTVTAEGGRYLLEGTVKADLGGGMLNDGKDAYVFLEKATVTYNGKTKEIAPLSSVVCFQGESILIYNYGSDAVYEELGADGASVMMENGINVDVVNDIYYKANGTKHLLFSDPGIFDPIQTEQEAGK